MVGFDLVSLVGNGSVPEFLVTILRIELTDLTWFLSRLGWLMEVGVSVWAGVVGEDGGVADP